MGDVARFLNEWAPPLIFVLVGYLLALVVQAIVNLLRAEREARARLAEAAWATADGQQTSDLPVGLIAGQTEHGRLITGLILGIVAALLLLALLLAVRLAGLGGGGAGPIPATPVISAMATSPPAAAPGPFVAPTAAPPTLTPPVPVVLSVTPAPVVLPTPTRALPPTPPVPPPTVAPPAPTPTPRPDPPAPGQPLLESIALEGMPGRAFAYSGEDDPRYGQGRGSLRVASLPTQQTSYRLSYTLPPVEAGYAGFLYRFAQRHDLRGVEAIELTVRFSDARAACEIFLRDESYRESRVRLSPALTSGPGITVAGTTLEKTVRLTLATTMTVADRQAIRALGCHSQTGATRGQHQVTLSGVRLIVP